MWRRKVVICTLFSSSMGSSSLAARATRNLEAGRRWEDGHEVGHDGPDEDKHEHGEREVADEVALLALALELLRLRLLTRQQEHEEKTKDLACVREQVRVGHFCADVRVVDLEVWEGKVPITKSSSGGVGCLRGDLLQANACQAQWAISSRLISLASSSFLGASPHVPSREQTRSSHRRAAIQRHTWKFRTKTPSPPSPEAGACKSQQMTLTLTSMERAMDDHQDTEKERASTNHDGSGQRWREVFWFVLQEIVVATVFKDPSRYVEDPHTTPARIIKQKSAWFMWKYRFPAWFVPFQQRIPPESSESNLHDHSSASQAIESSRDERVDDGVTRERLTTWTIRCTIT